MFIHKDTVIHEFYNNGVNISDVNIANQLVDMCHQFGLSGEALASKWEAYACNNNITEDITSVHLGILQHQLLEQQKRETSKKLFSTPTSNRSQSRVFGSDSKSGTTVDMSMYGGMAGMDMSQNNGYGNYHSDDKNDSMILDDTFSETFNVETVSMSAKRPGSMMMSPTSFGSPRESLSQRKPTSRSDQLFSPFSLGSPPSSGDVVGVGYEQRKNRGKIEFAYGSSSSTALLPSELRGLTSLCQVSIHPQYQTESYRYMFEKIGDKADIIDKHIDTFARKLMRKHQLDDSSPIGIPHQKSVTVFGQVMCDAEGRLNEHSVLLQGSRDSSSGAKTRLDLSELESFALFPGQVVGVKGVDSSGSRLCAEALYGGSMLPFMTSTAKDLYDFNYSASGLDGHPLHIIAAAGPFTTSDNMAYEPLADLLDVVCKEMPHVVILMGPYVDATHPWVASGENLEFATHEQFFDATTLKAIGGMLKASPRTQVVLVPSLRDVHHDLVFPQPPFTLTGIMKNEECERVICVPNPCTVSINEVTIGFTTVDILFDIGSQETARSVSNGGASDRMGRLASHIIEQRSFYPLRPPAQSVPLDYGHSKAINFGVTPDVLLLPSQLRPFAKNVQQCLAINPGSLSKGKSGGTFARIIIDPIRRNDIPYSPGSSDNDIANVKLLHQVHKRAKVEISRI